MEQTIMRAGLMSGLAMALFSTVPAQTQDGDGLTRRRMVLRAMRYERHRARMRDRMHREMHGRMMRRRVSHATVD